MEESKKQIKQPTPAWEKIVRAVFWAVYIVWMGLYFAVTGFRIDGDLVLTTFGVGFILLIIYAVNISATRSVIQRISQKPTER
ncbi:MAG TPA: hypothetical protein VN018_06705 [Brevundimonas sp.]|nr:hypothetical protein [Brevundimonas sp.]